MRCSLLDMAWPLYSGIPKAMVLYTRPTHKVKSERLLGVPTQMGEGSRGATPRWEVIAVEVCWGGSVACRQGCGCG